MQNTKHSILFFPLQEHLILSQKKLPKGFLKKSELDFSQKLCYQFSVCVFLHKYGDQRTALWKLVLSFHVVLRQSLSCFCCCVVYWPESFLLIILSVSNSEKESWDSNCLPQHQALLCGLWESNLGSQACAFTYRTIYLAPITLTFFIFTLCLWCFVCMYICAPSTFLLPMEAQKTMS